jgi:hypothetical protein
MKYQIQLQKNQHPRDLVYEVSVLYLVARVVHLAIQLQLTKHIGEGIDFNVLKDSLVDYDEKGLWDLLDILSVRQIFKLDRKKQRIYPTALSDSLQKNQQQLFVTAEDWLKHYEPFNDKSSMQHLNALLTSNVDVKITNYSVTLESDESLAILQEMAFGHIISRIIRQCTQWGFFDWVDKLSQPNTQGATIEALHELNQPFSDPIVLDLIVKTLSRYQFLQYQQEKVTLTELGAILTRRHLESLYPAMLMIEEKWWGATSCLEQSFLKEGKSAFEYYNRENFYSAYTGKTTIFGEGMAAISLFEDYDVAQTLSKLDTIHMAETIIDVGGGYAHLLSELHQRFPNKKNILFEKSGQDLNLLKKQIQEKYNITPDITLGDFMQSASHIPQCKNAVYIIKCCLHNLSDENVQIVLNNIYTAAGDENPIFVIERIIPPLFENFPHMNRETNLLMRLLFKASSHSYAFYRDAIKKVGLSLCEPIIAGNYLIMPVLSLYQYQKKHIPINKATHASFFTMSLDGATPVTKQDQNTEGVPHSQISQDTELNPSVNSV